MSQQFNSSTVKILRFVIVFALMRVGFTVSAQTSMCLNGNFEFGNTAGWLGQYGKRKNWGINLNSLSWGFDSDHHQIQNMGFDPEVGGNILPTVGEGSHSIRLGNPDPQKDASVLRYTFTVTNGNKDFGFMYAMVMEDGEHNANQNPYFSYEICEGLFPIQPSWFNSGNIIDSKKFVADLNNPYFKKSSGWVYKDWSFECVDLSAYVGETVTIIFSVADCAQGGHAGYAYIDGLCSENDAVSCLFLPEEVCLSKKVNADASCSQNEDSHFWAIQECDANGTGIGIEYSKWFVAQNAGTVELHNLMADLGGEFECNKYYRVKVAVSNECTQWHETTKIIKFKCPDITLRKDLSYCCGDEPTVVIGPLEKPQPGGTTNYYDWSIKPNTPYSQLIDGTGISFSPTENTTVSLEVTDDEGCSRTDEMKIWFLSEFNVWIESEKLGCCKELLTVRYEPKDDKCGAYDNLSQEDQDYLESLIEVTWMDGSTGATMIADGRSPLLYEAEVSIGNCFTYHVDYNYIPPDAYNTGAAYVRQMIAPNAFQPSSSIVKRQTFNILEFGPNAPQNWGDPNAYGIIGYQLSIFDRWGQLVKDIIDESCNIPQAGIMWDGTNQANLPVPGGVYLYRLRVKTCNGPNGTWHNICGSNLVGASHDAAGTTYCVDSYYCYAFCGGGLPWWQGTWVCSEYWAPTPNTDIIDFGDNSNSSCMYYVTLVR
ncbi:MAG: hypothetical protein H6599_10000 [Flavobacteriales bacterium]|nr:hypothetical protein [Flavobacteriales bacterium]